MRTKEQGLLTRTDAMLVAMQHEMPLRIRAHGGELLRSKDCSACDALSIAIGEWMESHAAEPGELLAGQDAT